MTGLHRPAIRTLWHTVGGLAIAIAALLLPRIVLLVALSAMAAALISFDLVRLKLQTVNRWFFSHGYFLLRQQEMSTFNTSTYFVLSSLGVIGLFPKELAVLAVLFLSVGDSAAALVGNALGRTRLRGNKTLEGSAACLVSCLAIGLAFRYGTQPQVAPAVIAVGSLAATLSEAFCFKLSDNITLPLSSAAAMWFFQTFIVP